MSDLEEKAGVIKQVTDIFPEPTKEVNKALTTVGKTINVVLAPLSALVWGYDRIAAWLEPKLAEKLENIPEENIITPPINVAGPTIEAMRFTGENDELREMYANLLASAMNKDTVHKAHPRFVEIVKNMTSDEAKLLSFMRKERILNNVNILFFTKVDKSRQCYFIVNNDYQLINIDLANLSAKGNLLIYMDNFCHLGILQDNSDPIGRYNKESNIDNIESEFPYIDNEFLASIRDDGKVLIARITYLSTSFGNSFVRQVINHI